AGEGGRLVRAFLSDRNRRPGTPLVGRLLAHEARATARRVPRSVVVAGPNLSIAVVDGNRREELIGPRIRVLEPRWKLCSNVPVRERRFGEPSEIDVATPVG